MEGICKISESQAHVRHLLLSGLNTSDVYNSFSFSSISSNQIHYSFFQMQTKYKSVLQAQMLKAIQACSSHLLRDL